MDSKETECDAVEWIQLAQSRVQLRTFVNTVMKLRIVYVIIYVCSSVYTEKIK
jgi:GTP-dependent phosphoenolpyruvate carboxykinase